MDWIDSGIVLHARPHGETSAVLDLFTREHGRHAGLVRGGRSRRIRPALQTGNLLKVEWRARLSEHLGFFTVELDRPHAARALDDRLALAGIGALASLAALLAERDPHPGLFDVAALMLDHLDEPLLWPQLLVRFELRLLVRVGRRARSGALRRDGRARRPRLCLAEIRRRGFGGARRAL